MSDKNKENELETDNSWKKRIKKPDIEEKELELHETEPFVDVIINEKEVEPFTKIPVEETETPAFVDVKIDNSQPSYTVCQKCGFHIKEENLNFCPKCGNKLRNLTSYFRR